MALHRYAEAEPLYRHALAIRERALGPDHPDTAASLNDLAYLLRMQDRYAEAEPLYHRALAISERRWGRTTPTRPPASTTWRTSMWRCIDMPRRSRCTATPWRSLSGRWGRTTPARPPSSTPWRASMWRMHRYAEAEPLYRHALAIRERALGPDHPDTAASLNDLAYLLRMQDRYAEAALSQ